MEAIEGGRRGRNNGEGKEGEMEGQHRRRQGKIKGRRGRGEKIESNKWRQSMEESRDGMKRIEGKKRVGG